MPQFLVVTGEPRFYREPTGNGLVLTVPPRLASWNGGDHPDQVRLAAALDHSADVVGPTLASICGPVAVRLDVALPATRPLLGEHDLDNYLYPLCTRLSGQTDQPILSAWCRKFHGDQSSISVEPAILGQITSQSARILHTSASSATSAYKQQIHDQLDGVAELPDGPVSLELAFVVGPTRNWLNLVKPTIDALERLLGRTRPDRAWHPRDGRITQLGLHVTKDESAGNDVTIAIATA